LWCAHGTANPAQTVVVNRLRTANYSGLPDVLGSFYLVVVNDRPASWRMPNLKQMERLARERDHMVAETSTPVPDQPLPIEWWDSVLADPRAAGKPWLPIEQQRLSELPREVLRVECLRCFRVVEIQKADAIRVCGPHAVWKDVGQRLLDNGCQQRTGRHEEDGCWPNWTR
jgi:hypothetical protein